MNQQAGEIVEALLGTDEPIVSHRAQPDAMDLEPAISAGDAHELADVRRVDREDLRDPVVVDQQVLDAEIPVGENGEERPVGLADRGPAAKGCRTSD